MESLNMFKEKVSIVNTKLRNKKKEEKLQMQFSKWMKDDYPDIIFVCDFAAGYKLPIWIGMLVKAMRSSSGLPDVIILEPNSEYKGLCIELKKDGSSPFKKDGGLKKDEHLEKQAAILERLAQKGYKASFAVGIEEAKKLWIEYYKKV